MGYGWCAGLGAGLIVAAATLRRTPPSHVALGVVPPLSPILVPRVIGAGAVSLALAISLGLTLPAALAALAFATHLRHTGRRPGHNHSQSQNYTHREPLAFFHFTLLLGMMTG